MNRNRSSFNKNKPLSFSMYTEYDCSRWKRQKINLQTFKLKIKNNTKQRMCKKVCYLPSHLLGIISVRRLNNFQRKAMTDERKCMASGDLQDILSRRFIFFPFFCYRIYIYFIFPSSNVQMTFVSGRVVNILFHVFYFFSLKKLSEVKNRGHYWHYIYMYIYYLYTKSDHTTSTFPYGTIGGSSVQQKKSIAKCPWQSYYVQYIYIYITLFCLFVCFMCLYSFSSRS